MRWLVAGFGFESIEAWDYVSVLPGGKVYVA